MGRRKTNFKKYSKHYLYILYDLDELKRILHAFNLTTKGE